MKTLIFLVIVVVVIIWLSKKYSGRSEMESFVKIVNGSEGSFIEASISRSPNGRYALAWCDAQFGGRDGLKVVEEGSFVLREPHKVITRGKIQRPNHGNVANNGTIVINDMMFGKGGMGTFYALDRQGNVLLKKLFQANLWNNGISPDGRFAVCQTCNSDNADGNVLTFFDLLTGKILWQKQPETSWADSYEFDLEKEIIYLVYRDKGKFAYSFSGEFIDAERWQAERIKQASGFELHAIARERFQNLDKYVDPNVGKEILSLLEKALQRGLDNYPEEQARIYRTMGELFEMLGEEPKAIESYERALRLSPKVGVKRKLEALKK